VAKKPKVEKDPKGQLPTGKLALRKDPRVYAREIPKIPIAHVRIVGLDLGTATGIAFCDIVPGMPITNAKVVLGVWDLAVGPYDSGPLRHIRLKQFLSILQPDVIMYENVKYDPPAELIKSRGMGPGAIVARVATAAEFLGGLKTTVSTWAEERSIPAQGVAIAQIKKFATGRGNAGKEDMIKACNEQFGTTLPVEDYQRTGADNMADAAFVCFMGIQNYSEGL